MWLLVLTSYPRKKNTVILIMKVEKSFKKSINAVIREYF
jgi:hypothetical protein